MSPAVTPFPSPMFLWLLLLFVAVAINLGLCHGRFNGTTTTPRCIHSEREALLEFKQHLTDPSHRLASWTASDADCCSWYGVTCDASTAHVLRLHLRTPSFAEFYGSYYYSEGKYAAYEKTVFGGKISSALVRLNRLRYLDLSGNDFRGIRIPAFLGSIGSLRCLNLSNAGFGGMIPHQLGNLSTLHYLHLGDLDYNSYVKDLEWISGLSSLKFLDMNTVDLSEAFNWEKKVLTTKLPSLQELHLALCQLPPPKQPIVNFSSSLSILDLSWNFNFGQLSSKILINWVSSLKNLNSLDLGHNGFQGPIPNEFKNMSSIRELYLNGNGFNASIPTWLYRHSHLNVLTLSGNQLSSFQPPPPLITLNFSSLSVLGLYRNLFQGLIPNELQNMTSLRKLELMLNQFNSSIPYWLYGFPRLEYLNLGDNDLEGEISSAIGNMTSLITLDLSWNDKLEFEGGINPMSLFQNLHNLRNLDLSGLKLRQHIGEVFEILSNKIEFLDLNGCQLFGNFNTTHLYLARFQNLAFLDLANNSISGQLPTSLGRLDKLEKLFINDNSLEGNVFETHFQNLTSLRVFDAHRNHLKLRVEPNWIPPFNRLKTLRMGSWHIGPQFPKWLRSLKFLISLDLSNSGISDSVPLWFWKLSRSFFTLNLSHNQIHGVILDLIKVQRNSLIDLSSNHFQGPLPRVSHDLCALDLSNNSFSGSISNFLCHNIRLEKYMKVLNLGANLLSGELPNCWKSWRSLVAINLSNNNFNGNISESIGTLNLLESLHLRNNNFSGKLPMLLKDCSNLVFIDIGENNLIGNISSFLDGNMLLGMKILNLRSNKLSGPIPNELCRAASLHILDLANNYFSGTIPRCIDNIIAMTRMNESTGILKVKGSLFISFFETSLLQMKGKMLEYSTNIGFVRNLDLSNNRLSGEIPKEMTSLQSLLSLNLSHNALTGEIPKSIGSMKGLESIDFSMNQLSGEIPESMSNLTFLGHLNLSHNQLSGKIPTGPQLQLFDASSFANNELCGLPLFKNCSRDHVMPNDSENEEDCDGNGVGIHWFYVCMTFGFVIGFWVVMGPLWFNRRWRIIYFQFLDWMGNKIWWHLYRFGVF